MKMLDKILQKITRPPYRISTRKNITADEHTFHNGNLSIRGRGKVFFGKYCALGKNISIISENHDVNYASLQGYFYKHNFEKSHPGNKFFPNPEKIKGDIIIGNDVWIGDNAMILSGVKIGNGACIAGGSIVTKNVNDYEIVAGVPAKMIKKRFPKEMCTYLSNLEWWDWSVEKIKQNESFFYANLNKLDIDELKKSIV